MGHSYRELIVWQKAVGMVTQVYRATRKFPRNEIYGLTNQLRRAAVSVPSNIAEGQGRLSKADFRHYLAQARGSLFEVETQTEIARNLGYLKDEELGKLLKSSGEVSRLLHGLMTSMAPAPRQPETRN